MTKPLSVNVGSHKPCGSPHWKYTVHTSILASRFELLGPQMMDMKRAMGPCRLRPDRPPIAHSFTRPFVQKPLAAGDSHRALPVVGYHARMLHSSRAVSVRSISSVRGEEFVTLPGADSDSGCKLIHLTEGTGADKLLVYLPGGYWEEHATLWRRGAAAACMGGI